MTNDSQRPGVSLVIPAYNEAADMPDVLDSIAAQDYPHSAIFLIVVDGGSSDRTVDIVREWLARSDIDGEVLHNPRRTIPTSLNAGIARARRSDIIVRLDAHTIYEPAYVRTIVDAFSSAPPSVGCVGGRVIPASEPRWDRAIVGALYTNPMGLGGADYRHHGTPRLVNSVYMGAWRPNVLQTIGGYDERWEANEDTELAARLRAAGYKTLWVPLQSSYRVKRGPIAVVRQWWRYGYWRAQTLRRHPSQLRARHLAPPVALMIALILLLTPLRDAAGLLFALYMAAIFAKRAPNEPFVVTLACCAFFPACQAAWGLGLLRGFAFGLPRFALAWPEPYLHSTTNRSSRL